MKGSPVLFSVSRSHSNWPKKRCFCFWMLFLQITTGRRPNNNLNPNPGYVRIREERLRLERGFAARFGYSQKKMCGSHQNITRYLVLRSNIFATLWYYKHDVRVKSWCSSINSLLVVRCTMPARSRYSRRRKKKKISHEGVDTTGTHNSNEAIYPPT